MGQAGACCGGMRCPPLQTVLGGIWPSGALPSWVSGGPLPMVEVALGFSWVRGLYPSLGVTWSLCGSASGWGDPSWLPAWQPPGKCIWPWVPPPGEWGNPREPGDVVVWLSACSQLGVCVALLQSHTLSFSMSCSPRDPKSIPNTITHRQ